MASTSQPIRRHADSHLPSGSDPLTFVTSGDGVAVVIAGLGDLSWYYRLGETGSFPAGPVMTDTSMFDSVARNAIYHENNPCPAEPWSDANRPSLDVPDPGLGDFDDGAVEFNYDQNVWQPFYDDRPGAYFTATTSATVGALTGDLAAFDTGAFPYFLRTAMCFFKPKRSVRYGATDFDAGTILGNRNFSTGGWAISYDPQTEVAGFSHGSTHNEISADAPATGAWYHAALTWDETAYRFYLNGVLIGTATLGSLTGGNVLHFDYARIDSGLTDIDSFYFGSIDEAAGFSRTLTEGEIAAVYETGQNSGGSSPAGYVWTAPGDGGPPTWQKSTIKVNY